MNRGNRIETLETQTNMAKIKLSELIDAGSKSVSEEKPRRYIGASGVGDPCDASLAYSLRGFPTKRPDPQLGRIFNLGHVIEDIVVKDLRKAGLEVLERDPTTGRQWAYKSHGGHVRGHADGIIVVSDRGYILEIKSMNNDKWNTFCEKGVQVSHRNYYSQLQMLMGLANVRGAYFIAYNKNNSKYHDEYVEFDEFAYSYLSHRVDRVFRSEDVRRIGADKSDWRCRGCFKREVCWEEKTPEPACSFCSHATPHPNKNVWVCSLTNQQSEKVCDRYEQYKPQDKE